jgi:hypothetical protein
MFVGNNVGGTLTLCRMSRFSKLRVFECLVCIPPVGGLLFLGGNPYDILCIYYHHF